MMNQNVLKAIVRSITPWLISVIVGLAARFHYHVTVDTAVKVVAILGTVVTIGAHWLEVKYPKFGILLGWIGAPAYQPGLKAQLISQIADLQAQVGTATYLAPVATPTSSGPLPSASAPAVLSASAPVFVPGAPLAEQPVAVAVDVPVASPVAAETVVPAVFPAPVA